MVTRSRRELGRDDRKRIADAYHRWRGMSGHEAYADIPGFCRSVDLDEIKRNGSILTPGRYVGSSPLPEDSEPVDQRIKRLAGELRDAFAESDRLQDIVLDQLELLDD